MESETSNSLEKNYILLLVLLLAGAAFLYYVTRGYSQKADVPINSYYSETQPTDQEMGTSPLLNSSAVLPPSGSIDNTVPVTGTTTTTSQPVVTQ